MAADGAETLRLDVWLWRARFFRTRSLASQHVSQRGVRITRHRQTRKVDKPGTSIVVGDVLTFTRARQVQTIEIAGLGSRRGPANEARTLYISLSEDKDDDGAACV